MREPRGMFVSISLHQGDDSWVQTWSMGGILAILRRIAQCTACCAATASDNAAAAWVPHLHNRRCPSHCDCSRQRAPRRGQIARPDHAVPRGLPRAQCRGGGRTQRRCTHLNWANLLFLRRLFFPFVGTPLRRCCEQCALRVRRQRVELRSFTMYHVKGREKLT